MAWPKGKPRGGDRFVASEKANKPETTVQSGDRPSENPGSIVAKIQFGTVRLDHEVERLGGSKGLAKSSSSQFDEKGGCTVELDTGTGLVTITHTLSGEQHIAPRERVLFFKPVTLKVEDKPATA